VGRRTCLFHLDFPPLAMEKEEYEENMQFECMGETSFPSVKEIVQKFEEHCGQNDCWSEEWTEDGQSYWYNYVTGVSQWRKPFEASLHADLHCAVTCNDLGEVGRLFQLGGDIDAVNAENFRPIHLATSTEMFHLLISLGARIIEDGETEPLSHFYARKDEKIDVLRALLASFSTGEGHLRQDAPVFNEMNQSFLHVAVLHRCKKAVSLGLEWYIDGVSFAQIADFDDNFPEDLVERDSEIGRILHQQKMENSVYELQGFLEHERSVSEFWRQEAEKAQILCDELKRENNELRQLNPNQAQDRAGDIWARFFENAAKASLNRKDPGREVPECGADPVNEEDCNWPKIAGLNCSNKSDELELVRKIENALDQNFDIDLTDDEWGRTALHFAAETGNFAVLEFLIQNGARISIPDALGNHPIHLAADGSSKMHLKCIRSLLRNRANFFARNDEDLTPLDIAKLKKDVSKAGKQIQSLLQQLAQISGDEPRLASKQRSIEASWFSSLFG